MRWCVNESISEQIGTHNQTRNMMWSKKIDRLNITNLENTLQHRRTSPSSALIIFCITTKWKTLSILVDFFVSFYLSSKFPSIYVFNSSNLQQCFQSLCPKSTLSNFSHHSLHMLAPTASSSSLSSSSTSSLYAYVIYYLTSASLFIRLNTKIKRHFLLLGIIHTERTRI